jgi:REP element-mobilizing transposase RayT
MGRKRWFDHLPAGRAVVRELLYAEHVGMATTFAYVVMPDHLHWLMQLRPGADLSSTVGRVKGRSARSINRRLSRKGAVWQRAFHDHAVRKEEDLRMMARYVITNPLRAGLVESVGDYPLWDAIWLTREARLDRP